MRTNSYAYPVPGTLRIIRGSDPKITLEMGVVRYQHRLSDAIFEDLQGITLRFLRVRPTPAGPVDLYQLEVRGGAMYCVAVECVLISVVVGDNQKRLEFLRLAKSAPRHL